MNGSAVYSMREDLSSAGDWIKIRIKFSGSCLHCKKKINIGEVGYWSRKAKSIVHENCFLQFDEPIQQEKGEGYRRNNQTLISEKDNPDNTLLKMNDNAQCYICNSLVDIRDPLIIELSNIDFKKDHVKAYYCATCLKVFNKAIFNKYKTTFQSKIKR